MKCSDLQRKVKVPNYYPMELEMRVGVKLKKITRNCLKCAYVQRKVMLFNHHPNGVGVGPNKKYFPRNCTKCSGQH